MESPKTLRRPANWQDFETLCKKLWGEIWSCPEIQKNGRSGQNQHGVDIFGMPLNEEEYYGIQCKGKDEYTDAQFTEKEISEEVEKAKKFDPPLKKFYLTTTAVSDAKIQTFVRKLNVEHKSKGIFEIHLFSWESIVELIDDNKHVLKWYMMLQGYKTNQNISINFDNGLTEISTNPKFKLLTTYYKDNYRYANIIIPGHDHFLYGQRTVNFSFVPINIIIRNTGIDPIENHKIILEFIGDVIDITDTNESGIAPLLGKYAPTPDVFLGKDNMTAKLIPLNKMFVGGDTYKFDTIFLKPKPQQCEVIVNWRLISKDYRCEGKLTIYTDPIIEKASRTISVNGSSELKPTHTEFIDYVEYKINDKD